MSFGCVPVNYYEHAASRGHQRGPNNSLTKPHEAETLQFGRIFKNYIYVFPFKQLHSIFFNQTWPSWCFTLLWSFALHPTLIEPSFTKLPFSTTEQNRAAFPGHIWGHMTSKLNLTRGIGGMPFNAITCSLCQHCSAMHNKMLCLIKTKSI